MPKRKTKAVEEPQKKKDQPIAKKRKIEPKQTNEPDVKSEPKITAPSSKRGRPKKVVAANASPVKEAVPNSSSPGKKSPQKGKAKTKSPTVKTVAKKSPAKPKIEEPVDIAEPDELPVEKETEIAGNLKPAGKRGRPPATKKSAPASASPVKKTSSTTKKPGRPKKQASSATGNRNSTASNSTGRGKGKTSTIKKKNSKMSSEEQAQPSSATATEGDSWKNASSVYDFTANDIDGNPVSLEKYKGHVLLIVNVASKCGLTSKNYVQLVQLDEKYRDRGLRILGFPCNQFAKQEPGTAEQICAYAKKKNVEFDIFEKINVNGETAHPLWKYLKMKQAGTFGDLIKWNFSKFLVNREGQPVERFAPTKDPLSITDQIENLL